MQERFYKVVGKVLKLWERLYRREKVGKVSKFQERLFNDNFKAGNGEERKGKGKLSVPPRFPQDFCSVLSRLLDNVYDFQGDFEKHNESVYIFSHVCLYITDTEKKGSFGLLS